MKYIQSFVGRHPSELVFKNLVETSVVIGILDGVFYVTRVFREDDKIVHWLDESWMKGTFPFILLGFDDQDDDFW